MKNTFSLNLFQKCFYSKCIIVICLFLLPPVTATPVSAKKNIKVLLISGQNNHDWKRTHPFMKKALDAAKIFETDIVLTTTPEEVKNFSAPFDKYDVVLFDYNTTDNWPKATQEAFEKYVRKGGGVVIVHASNNSFPQWPAFNEMIGLGGWGDRNEKWGPYAYWENGKLKLDYSPGIGGSHGARCDIKVINRNPQHPIMKGLPQVWLREHDELYDQLRGPAQNMTILGTAYSVNSKREEPVIFTLTYGKGRIFHWVCGHLWEGDSDMRSLESIDFITLLQRGTEWAATGKVKQKVPDNFPTEDKAQYSTTIKVE